MPVTLILAEHPAKDWDISKETSSTAFLGRARKSRSKTKIIQTSLSDDDLREKHISQSGNGLVWAAFHAYSNHHHLVLRPEDVWFAILSQFNFFVNAHAEELRDYFVSHKDKKKLEVKEIGNLQSVDIGVLARRMADLIQEHVKQPGLRDWIMPSFSTTTDSDRAVAAVLMMGAMQRYFRYQMTLKCGIPSVQLLGERKDWEDMLERLEYLVELGPEPALFARLLRPILRNFVKSFDSPLSAATKDFWGKIAHKKFMGSGAKFLEGWITAFCFWDEDGKMLYKGKMPREDGEVLEDNDVDGPGCKLDSVTCHSVDTEKIPAGFASVPVTVYDNEVIHHTKMLAGSVGIEAKHSGPSIDGSNEENSDQQEMQRSGLDTIQPVSGWIMFETADPPSTSQASAPSSAARLPRRRKRSQEICPQEHPTSSPSNSPPRNAPKRPKPGLIIPCSPAYAPSSSDQAPNSPKFTIYSPELDRNSPDFSPTSPVYTPTSPGYAPDSPIAWTSNSQS
jgi:hypothetical protein